MSPSSELRNLARNARRPGYLPEMGRKAWRRLRHPRRRATAHVARQWAEQHAQGIDDFARSLDDALWREAGNFETALRERAHLVLNDLPVRLGGGGHYRLAYFLVRLVQPSAALETGVAAGFSTTAILSGLERNGHGRLWSNDLPYFRLAEPERHVGVLVPQDLQGRWSLHVGSDRQNVPRMLQAAGAVDLVHYDSDKSYDGRAATTALVEPHLSSGAVMMMDDIDDNLFFRDWVDDGRSFRVFEFEGKFVGLVGL